MPAPASVTECWAGIRRLLWNVIAGLTMRLEYITIILSVTLKKIHWRFQKKKPGKGSAASHVGAWSGDGQDASPGLPWKWQASQCVRTMWLPHSAGRDGRHMQATLTVHADLTQCCYPAITVWTKNQDIHAHLLHVVQDGKSTSFVPEEKNLWGHQSKL